MGAGAARRAPDRGQLRDRRQRYLERGCGGQGHGQGGEDHHHQRQGPSVAGRHRAHGAGGRGVSGGGDSEKGVADKIGDDDKETIEKALEEVNEWLDDNQDAEKEDFDEKLKEVQDTCSPIISKVYQESGGAPGGGGDFGGDDDLDGHDEL